MIIECCSQEKTFVRYYALLGARFCMLRREFQVGCCHSYYTFSRVHFCEGQGLEACGSEVEDCGSSDVPRLRSNSMVTNGT
jgi:hypothetical protein